MENRGALRFVVGALSRQPYQRRQSARARHSARAQPRGHGTSAGSLNPTAKPDLPRRAVPTLAQQARRPESHHRHGSSPRPTGLSNVEVWSAVRRQRCGVLRAEETANNKSSSSERRLPNSAYRSHQPMREPINQEVSTLSAIAIPRQRRGKSLMRRKYQQGHVYPKGQTEIRSVASRATGLCTILARRSRRS